MNNQNLKPITSKSEARELGRKGGKASGKSRSFKKTLQILSQGKLNDEALKRNLQKMGLSEEEADKATVDMAVAFSLLSKAIKGDTKAIQIYTNLTGQNEEKALEMQIKKAELELKKRELELKEKELERRLAPAGTDDRVVIVNDLKEDSE